MTEHRINDGGPAFPESCNGQIISGMTLRDYFAGQALAGGGFDASMIWDTVAMSCYEASDAMLAARERKPE